MKRPDEARSKFWERFASRSAVSDGFVIDVRQIHHAIDLKAARLQMALQQVFEQKRSEIADVRVRIDGRSAGVHLHVFSRWIDWPEWFNRARVGIIELNHAGFAFGVWRSAAIYCGLIRAL